ncbi:YerC/YecD family TrpR-related protein [Robiginitomaculum antarcticum]|uniref:YerC/YecD family TrpR-related protein n=1 Tax=Robiginitomaculum antarcticum TaxID=437507 RepID=UPI0003809CD9|nr:YerC/YecD family TrpR-related protein [Robiginitomaculum antarcticum]
MTDVKSINETRQTDEAMRLTFLAEALVTIEQPTEMRRFLVDLCTPAELRALSERWHVAKILHRGELSYRDINARTGVSTTTIGRVARFLKEEPHKGYRVVLDRLDAQKDTL